MEERGQLQNLKEQSRKSDDECMIETLTLRVDQCNKSVVHWRTRSKRSLCSAKLNGKRRKMYITHCVLCALVTVMVMTLSIGHVGWWRRKERQSKEADIYNLCMSAIFFMEWYKKYSQNSLYLFSIRGCIIHSNKCHGWHPCTRMETRKHVPHQCVPQRCMLMRAVLC